MFFKSKNTCSPACAEKHFHYTQGVLFFTYFPMQLAHKSILEIKNLLDSKQLTSQQVWEYFHERIKKYNSELHAFNSINEAGYNPSDEVLQGIPLGLRIFFVKREFLRPQAQRCSKISPLPMMRA